MPPYRIGNVFRLIKFTCNPGNTHLFVVLFLRGRERGTFVAGPCSQVVMSAEKDLVMR